ncbi:hypothetical protein G5V59_04055 [Nocardioides sp. W3-2-3]|uniref:hypothetical protein n=1 Tax=Nocardioides convexus TaxID=2712224 RepID=UPI0024187FCC|nr:hypothetical protein [Nocardioides convexus]NGZ99789.1 hypothetical protein [Nocardioides convexus]
MPHHYLAWTGTTLPERLDGPWTEYRRVADDLALLESEHPLSPVYHEPEVEPARGHRAAGRAAARPTEVSRASRRGRRPGCATGYREDP